MTLNKLASLIAKREGKKSQARIGDIREILKIICLIDAESCISDPDNGSKSALTALTNGTNKELDKLYKKPEPRKAK